MYRRTLPHHSPMRAAISCVEPESLQGLSWQGLTLKPARHTHGMTYMPLEAEHVALGQFCQCRA